MTKIVIFWRLCVCSKSYVQTFIFGVRGRKKYSQRGEDHLQKFLRNLFIGQLRRGGASLCFHSIGCTMGNMNKEKSMIYQCILAFHDDNMIIMKPKIYHNKNDIVILYINIETFIQSSHIFDFFLNTDMLLYLELEIFWNS